MTVDVVGVIVVVVIIVAVFVFFNVIDPRNLTLKFGQNRGQY